MAISHPARSPWSSPEKQSAAIRVWNFPRVLSLYQVVSVKVDERENIIEKETDAEKEKDVEGRPESQRKLSIESPTGKEGKDDVFVYLCPFPACDFSTDFEVSSFYWVSNRFESLL